MSALEGFEVMEPVKNYRRMNWNCGDTIAAFLATGNQAMGKRFDDRRAMVSAYGSLHNYAKRHDEPVDVVRHGDTIILVRKDEA